MRTAIITVAGVSSRFNEGIEKEAQVLKAIHHEGDKKNTLLNHLIQKVRDFDYIVVVGGFKYDDLVSYIDNYYDAELRSKIITVFNDHYEDWSSGYSLYLGLEQALSLGTSEVLFIEGDLDFDDKSFQIIVAADKSVLTFNRDIIRSNKAVIVYQDLKKRFKYVFSTNHGAASIDEPFLIILNSGQTWKFRNMDKLKEAMGVFSEVKETGTNLIIVGEYFGSIPGEEIEVIGFDSWTNCNTREDYKKITQGWNEE